MANLVSPGVSVTVTDESFYNPSGPGTVPLIFISTKENKLTPDGAAVAPGTLASNANRLYLVSSQRELLQTFGNPDFNSVGGTAQNGNALNEYGLLAAYSFMGVSNRAYIVRADLDLGELEPRTSEPTSPPADLTYWVDLNALADGLFVSDGTNWVKQAVTIVEADITIGDSSPNSGFVNGDLILAAGTDSTFTFFERVAGTWQAVSGVVSPHTSVPVVGAPGDFWLKVTPPNQGAQVNVQLFDGEIGQFVNAGSVVFAEDSADYYSNITPGTQVAAGTLAAFYGPGPELGYTLQWHNGESQVVATSVATTDPTLSLTIEVGSANETIGPGTINDLVQDIGSNAALIAENIVASEVNGAIVITNTVGEDFEITVSGLLGMDGVYSNFSPVDEAAPAYFATFAQPTSGPTAGALWYDPGFEVDLLVKDGGTNDWEELAGTLFVQPDEPTAPAAGDVWVETDRIDEYPVIYRRVGTEWVLVDNTDQTTPAGIVFADARVAPGDPLDTDAPDPNLYPGGVLLWNTRFSSRNVKQWTPDYVFQGAPVGDRWVSVSGTNQDGSLITGRRAVRAMVVQKLAEVIRSNEDIRAETTFFNLLAAPGFPELIDELLDLNIDRRETAFVIGDTPFNLNASSTSLQNWATNAANAPGNGELGLVSANENLGVYYPSGLTTNLDGTEVVVPASHMVLRTMAFNDQVAYPWFAPAGFQRGTVTNASAVGYLNAQDEFVAVTLNQGQRDVLYTNNINPIANIPGRGIVVYGQKTRSPVASALDRVNVARLVNYIRFQAERISEPFLFEPNDSQTRNAVKERYETFLAELVTLRGVFDFLVVCDETNNTPARIDRNELWVDIAISPTKAVEFIYIPIRIRNTGADLSL